MGPTSHICLYSAVSRLWDDSPRQFWVSSDRILTFYSLCPTQVYQQQRWYFDPYVIILYIYHFLNTHHFWRSLRSQSHSFFSELRTVETHQLHPLTHMDQCMPEVFISPVRYINCLPMETSKELLLATWEWDQKSSYKHQDKQESSILRVGLML